MAILLKILSMLVPVIMGVEHSVTAPGSVKKDLVTNIISGAVTGLGSAPGEVGAIAAAVGPLIDSTVSILNAAGVFTKATK